MGGEIGSRSESKVVEKRSSAQFVEKLERCKRVKMRDLESVCRSEEIVQSNCRILSVDKEKCHEPLNAATEVASKTLPPVVEPGIISSDVNSNVRLPHNSATMSNDATLNKSKGFCWDLNADVKSNSPNKDSFFPFKNREHLTSGDLSECGSTTGQLEDNDPMRVWQEMKENGFLSSSYASITLPKQGGRKSKSEYFKKKMELAKKEQVDRFAKIASPSGLLNELNPGIINHVRNRKQVHSIIEALVRLEKDESRQGVGKQDALTRSCSKDDYVSGLVMNKLGVSHDGSSSTLSKSQHIGGLLHHDLDHSGRDDNICNVERWFFDKNSFPLQKKQDTDDDVLALKLGSSTTKASGDFSSLSNEESANLGSVSSLSIKGATVALHWLELLQQDIKGRLAALKRSKNRVRSVISTELPFLLSREFSGSTDGCSISENADAHRAKWSALFDQLDKTLYEEEKQMVIWLHQVKEMQLQCDEGLHQFHSYTVHGSGRLGTSETDHRSEEVEMSETKFVVRAAAASIYSTCNFLLSAENLPCS